MCAQIIEKSIKPVGLTAVSVAGVLVIAALVAFVERDALFSFVRSGNDTATVEFVGTVESEPEDEPADSLEYSVAEKIRQEKAALGSYARKIETTMRSANTVTRSYSAISAYPSRYGLVIDLQDSGVGRIFFPASNRLRDTAIPALRSVAQFLAPFANPIDVYVFNSPGGSDDSETALTQSTAQAVAIRQELLTAGLPAHRLQVVGARGTPLVPTETAASPEQQILILMHYTDFERNAPKSRAEEVQDLFREFDRRQGSRSIPLQASRPASEQVASDRPVSSSHGKEDVQVSREKADQTSDQPDQTVRPIEKEFLFGQKPMFGPPDPFS